MLIIEPGRSSGFSASALDKMGCGASDTGLITLDDVFVPDENLLGEEGRGFRMIMVGYVWERIHMSLVALGAMSSWFGRTCDFVRNRQAFGRPLSHNQVIAHELPRSPRPSTRVAQSPTKLSGSTPKAPNDVVVTAPG